MAEFFHWNSGEVFDGIWDICFLADDELPGRAIVEVTLPSDLDVQKPKGARKPRIKDEGDPPAKITIRLLINTQFELDELLRFVPLLRARSKSSARDPITIYHPNCAFWGIYAVIIENVDSPQPSAVDGWEITIDCLEWWPAPEPVKSQSKKAKAAAQAAKEADVITAWQQFADEEPAPTSEVILVENLPLETV